MVKKSRSQDARMLPHGGGGPSKADVVVLSSSSVSEAGGEDAEAEVKSRADSSVKKRKKLGGWADGGGAPTQVKKVAYREGQREKERKRNNKKNKDARKTEDGEKKKKQEQEEEEGIKRGGEHSTSSASSVLGPCSFPVSRVKRLVRSGGGNGATAETRTTHEAVFLLNKAAEMFLQLFTKDAYASAMKEHRRFIAYAHLSSTVYKEKRYEFLSDFVPEEVRAEDALKAVKALAEP